MQFKNRTLSFQEPHVMGILNVTPDSFSDGGQFTGVESAVSQARQMVAEGASILDIGGESTRPGAQAVDTQQELDRVIPVIEQVHAQLDAPISIDTSKPDVMREAVSHGASMINDVKALQAEGALQAASELNVPVCLMHMKGEPRTMQQSPVYHDVVGEVKQFLLERQQACIAAGINSDQLILDPGFGFGKTPEHNLTLVRQLAELTSLGAPVLLGVSRKSTIGSILDVSVEKRLHGSVALAGLAVWLGASIIRVHDVGPTVDALKVIQAVKNTKG